MKLQEIYSASKIFYYMTSGRHAYTITLQVGLTVKVNKEHLCRAVKRAMNVHPHFYNRPVISGNKVYTVRQDRTEIPVFPETNEGRCYGTEDTYGYLFYVTFDGTNLYLRMFHGLCDGRGGYMFLRTLLYFYFQECGSIFEPNPDTVTELKAKEPFDAYRKTLETINGNNRKSAGVSGNKNSFALPETFFGDETGSYKLMEIDTQLLPLLETSKKCSSSVAPFLASLIGDVMHDLYEVGDKTIVTYMPVDLRTRFGFETSENASSSTYLPYTAEMQQLSPEERAGKLRNILNFLAEPENQYEYVAFLSGMSKELESNNAPIEAVSAAFMEKMKQSMRTSVTYLMSYAGTTPVPEEMSPFVKSFRFIADPYTVPLNINIIEHKGTVRIMFSMFFDNHKIVHAIYKKMKEILPETVLFDFGTRTEDTLILEKLEHI